MMRSPAGAVLSIVFAALVAGCADEAPRPTEPAANLALTTTGAPACDITELKRAARAFFASNQDPIFTIISALQTELKNGQTPATTQIVLAGWDRISQARLTSAQKNGATGAEGNAVARGFLGCADFDFIAKAPPTANYSMAIGTGGLFEVIFGSRLGTSTPAYSKGGAEIWATHPPAGKTWGDISPVPHLIYGYHTSLFTPDQPISATAFHFTTSPLAYDALNDVLVPLTYTPGVVRGVCISDGTSYRIQRNQSILIDAPLNCDGAGPTQTTSASNSIASFAYRLMEYIAPQPLQAQSRGGVAGMGSEYSDHIGVDVTVAVSFVSQPLDGFVNWPIPGQNGFVQVLVATLGGTPLPGVPVTLTVANNSGSTVMISGNVESTDANGIATFPNLTLNKAGGYLLWANATFDGLAGNQATSDLFTIKNQ